ncbi:MAG: DEAD/DEAH box helicase [Phycisphaerales bacterium]|nr:DEAD/DEAH box helicase [Phycisphaerales bacterium]
MTPSTTSAPAGAPTPFSSLPLSPQLLRAIRDEGYDTPTPIQAQAIPPALNGRDILGCAQTGTGKTAAFALPILHKLHTEGVADDRGRHLPRALILSPTRELAGQIADSFAAYGRHTRLRHTTIYGGVSQYHQEKALHRGVDILVATPGRLIDLLDQGIVDLSEVSIFVLDEADRMLDMGFIQPIRRIASELSEERQTLLFSATMPREIVSLADSLLSNPVRVTVTPVASAAPLIEQSVYMVGRHQKQALLHHLIGEHGIERTLVFTRTKHGADKVARRLNRAGILAEAIHGNKSQNQRQRALDGFRKGKSRVLVATDVAARGLDIDDVSHVFNFDIPNEPEAYIHRIGRTGRAGASGAAIAFCDHEERSLLRDIERLTGKRIDAISELPELPNLAAAEAKADAIEDAERPIHRGARPQGSPRSPKANAGPRQGPKPGPRSRRTPNGRPQSPNTRSESGASSETQQGSGPNASKPRNFAGPNARRGQRPAGNGQGSAHQGRGAAPRRTPRG